MPTRGAKPHARIACENLLAKERLVGVKLTDKSPPSRARSRALAVSSWPSPGVSCSPQASESALGPADQQHSSTCITLVFRVVCCGGLLAGGTWWGTLESTCPLPNQVVPHLVLPCPPIPANETEDLLLSLVKRPSPLPSQLLVQGCPASAMQTSSPHSRCPAWPRCPGMPHALSLCPARKARSWK